MAGLSPASFAPSRTPALTNTTTVAMRAHASGPPPRAPPSACATPASVTPPRNASGAVSAPPQPPAQPPMPATAHGPLCGTPSAAGPSGGSHPAGRASHRSRDTAAAATAAALLLLVAPQGPLAAGPAAARIPTETVLSDGGGAAAATATPSGRSALLQLAVPPSAVVAPAQAEYELPAAITGAGPGPGSGATRGSGAGPGRIGVAPGTMVGTPNYARGSIAGQGPRSTASEAAEALRLLSSAREAVDVGQHDRALEFYGRLVSEHPDLALAEYGRIGRAMMLYQVGRTSDSILALEDEEVAMRGAAEVHAALAALLYSERPSLALRAEEEWNLACLFDKRYSDTEWVRTNKHWPPRMIAALQKFLSLS